MRMGLGCRDRVRGTQRPAKAEPRPRGPAPGRPRAQGASPCRGGTGKCRGLRAQTRPTAGAQGEEPVGLLTEERGLLWSHSPAQSLPALGQLSEVHKEGRGRRRTWVASVPGVFSREEGAVVPAALSSQPRGPAWPDGQFQTVPAQSPGSLPDCPQTRSSRHQGAPTDFAAASARPPRSYCSSETAPLHPQAQGHDLRVGERGGGLQKGMGRGAALRARGPGDDREQE